MWVMAKDAADENRDRMIVGFADTTGSFQGVMWAADHITAARLVNYLNGGEGKAPPGDLLESDITTRQDDTA